jgi:hypothetical protein
MVVVVFAEIDLDPVNHSGRGIAGHAVVARDNGAGLFADVGRQSAEKTIGCVASPRPAPTLSPPM